jgi:hypothetical protein
VFRVDCRQSFPCRITEGLPVPPAINSGLQTGIPICHNPAFEEVEVPGFGISMDY